MLYLKTVSCLPRFRQATALRLAIFLKSWYDASASFDYLNVGSIPLADSVAVPDPGSVALVALVALGVLALGQVAARAQPRREAIDARV